MIVTGSDGVPHATLTTKFVDAQGQEQILDRQGNHLVVDTVDASGIHRQQVDSIHYRNSTGTVVDATLVPPGYVPLAGPRPAVAGLLLPGVPHNLRPNPVSTDGTFNLDQFTTDYDYAWSMSRFDTASGQWQNVTGLQAVPNGAAANYGARFTPTQTGAYKATVVMTPKNAPSIPPATGVVEFTVRPPDIAGPVLELTDNGSNQLAARLQLTEPVPDDTLSVSVQWPGRVDSNQPGPASSVELPCHGTDAFNCSTVDTAKFADLVAALQFGVDRFTDLQKRVKVTVTNRFGGANTWSLPIVSAKRPQMNAPGAAPAGQPGHVLFDNYVTHVQVPVSNGGDSNYTIATIVPGTSDLPDTSIGVLDPATGQLGPFGIVDLFASDPGRKGQFQVSASKGATGWELTLRATPDYRDQGSFEFPITVQQDTGTFRTLILRLDIVVAPDDKYRAVLDNSIDPANFAVDSLPTITPIVGGGKAEWDAYTGDYCLSLDDQQVCKPVAELASTEVTPRTFPYAQLAPHGLDAGTHEVKAWLPTAGDHVYAEPFVVSFLIRTGAPKITSLTWDQVKGQASLAIKPYSADAPITSVICRVDGQPVAACFGLDGGTWTPTGLTPGAHTLDVTVTDKAGNLDSATLAFTVLATFTTGPTAGITGSAVVGQTLTATEGTPAPAPDSYTYQWLADGTPIAGATAKTLNLTTAQQGKKITVTVTAVKAGYLNATSTSAPTAAVAPAPVTKKPSTTIAANVILGIGVLVKGAPNTALPTGTVTLMRGTTVLATKTLVSGAAFFPKSLYTGLRKVTLQVKYAGDANYLPSSTSITVG